MLERAKLDWPVVDHDPPATLGALWARDDLGCVQMCGFPFSRRLPQPRSSLHQYRRRRATAASRSTSAISSCAPTRRFARSTKRSAHRVGYTLKDSQSGYLALRHHLLDRTARPGAIVGPLVTARRVLEAVVAGEIDLGSLDSYVHDILRFHEPALAAGARVLETTAPTPIPPFVATGPVDDATLGRLQDSFLAVADERSLDGPRPRCSCGASRSHGPRITSFSVVVPRRSRRAARNGELGETDHRVAVRLGLVLALAAVSGHAQPYPSKPIRIVNAFAPGGPADLLARLVAQKLQEAWGQPVIVESKTGAAGNIGMEFVAKAPPTVTRWASARPATWW